MAEETGKGATCVTPAVMLAVTVLSAAPMAVSSVESPLQAVPAAIRVQLAVAAMRLPNGAQLRRSLPCSKAPVAVCLAHADAARAAPWAAAADPGPAPAPAVKGSPQVPVHQPMLCSRPSRAP